MFNVMQESHVLLLVVSFLQIAGEILIAIIVIRVHTHLLKEKRVDRDVANAISDERHWAYVGMGLLVAGYILEVFIRLGVV